MAGARALSGVLAGARGHSEGVARSWQGCGPSAFRVFGQQTVFERSLWKAEFSD